MTFTKEIDFEDALTKILFNKGWDTNVLMYPSEEDLINNWANILYKNNRDIDRLNSYPLTSGEMQQIMEQITALRTPLKLNGFINGKTVTIKRDNIDDKQHFGKEVCLKIYDRKEISAGQSTYQIVRQPKFKSKSDILNNRRGDIMLLINGMPVIHIELKRSGVPVSDAYRQIEKYSHEGIFTGLFSLVQIFIAMTPEETRYFANPGSDGVFNPEYYFEWADFYNEPIKDWMTVADRLISIPMAHKLIGFYTVADESDGVLKVMRSYQYYAASAISDKVSKNRWDESNQLGGYIWHTTGSGKTMTSFKSAQLISNSKDADKVIFLTDRIELGTQSYNQYRNFANDNESVQNTESTYELISKLTSNAAADTLIITSIQKMSNIKNEDSGYNAHDIELIAKKRLVFIIDECHRSTFGDMLRVIKDTFPNALFFGFTGTPIFDENQKKMNTTVDIFGNELHRYSIADGIRDKNVLGFDPYMVMTFKDKDVRREVALHKSNANSVDDANSDPKKFEIYNKYMKDIPMAGYRAENGSYIRGIEDEIPNKQYLSAEHQQKVVEDIISGWNDLSINGKFHAIFATSSIPEAIDYYRLFKNSDCSLKITCLFDPHISNEDGEYREYKGMPAALYKEDGLVEIIKDYNKRYNQKFDMAAHASFKKDVSFRLAHKESYKSIEKTPEKELDLLIVVNQMLTGFDSKWINTLYIDKLMEYQDIIQAFSRTNRLFGHEKRFGTIKYYRKPYTMKRNIDSAVKSYSGDKSFGLFVEKLNYNLEKMNSIYTDITELFTNSGISDFNKLPADRAVRAKFAQLFKEFNNYLDAAKIQGFKWYQTVYTIINENTKKQENIMLKFAETDYLVLVQRYKELLSPSDDKDKINSSDEVTYDLVGYLVEIDTDKIDSDYMNSRFEKYMNLSKRSDVSEETLHQTLDELHKSFATLTQDEQKYAEIFLRDVQRNCVVLQKGKVLRDYITEYLCKAKDAQIHKFSTIFGLNEDMLRNMMGLNLNEMNINEFGRFDKLKSTLNKAKAKEYFEKVEGVKFIPPKVNAKADRMLREFIFLGGFDLDEM